MSEDNNTRLIGKPYQTSGGSLGQARECLNCHEWFGSNAAFLLHKVSDGSGGKRCLSVEEMEQHSNMHLSGGAMWRTGPDPKDFSRSGYDAQGRSYPRKKRQSH